MNRPKSYIFFFIFMYVRISMGIVSRAWGQLLMFIGMVNDLDEIRCNATSRGDLFAFFYFILFFLYTLSRPSVLFSTFFFFYCEQGDDDRGGIEGAVSWFAYHRAPLPCSDQFTIRLIILALSKNTETNS